MASTLKVQNIAHTGGTTAMTVDSSGRVTKPQTPAFHVGLASAQTLSTTAATVLFEDRGTSYNNFLQGGITISSGVITVPVAGVYQFNTLIRANSVGSGFITARIMRNSMSGSEEGGYIIIGNTRSTDYDNLTGSTVYNMSASDTVKIEMKTSADTSWNVGTQSEFSGFLIG
tara:strand:+ start:1189 stop:1704 length:516 start_codon:yes stop_codon:yes gene_type:complete